MTRTSDLREILLLLKRGRCFNVKSDDGERRVVWKERAFRMDKRDVKARKWIFGSSTTDMDRAILFLEGHDV